MLKIGADLTGDDADVAGAGAGRSPRFCGGVGVGRALTLPGAVVCAVAAIVIKM